jgi:lauroyl/myristoyl acyltransferase
MAGKNGLGALIALGAVGLVGGVTYVSNKIHNVVTDIKVTKAKNELNEKIIESQNEEIKELKKKLKKGKSE